MKLIKECQQNDNIILWYYKALLIAYRDFVKEVENREIDET